MGNQPSAAWSFSLEAWSAAVLPLFQFIRLAIALITISGAVPLSRERLFDVPSAHQPGRKDALWKQQVNGVTTPFVPTVGRSARTTSKCTAMPHDVCAAPPVNALSVQTRARSLKHCAPHARSSW